MTMDGVKEIVFSKVPNISVQDIRILEEHDDERISLKGDSILIMPNMSLKLILD